MSCWLILYLTDLYKSTNGDHPLEVLSWTFAKFDIHNLVVFTDITASFYVCPTVCMFYLSVNSIWAIVKYGVRDESAGKET